MDKRSYSLVVSPAKSLEMNKKLKMSVSPKLESNENNGNTLNFTANLLSKVDDELDGLCFDDDDDEFYNQVISILPQVTRNLQ